MRYVLWSGVYDIQVGANDEEGRYTFKASTRHWRSVLSDMAVRVMADGLKISMLEIQAHGHPAQIHFPRGDINWDNVADFATMLRPIMVPGGLIEVMCCLVADVSRFALRNGGPITYSQAVLDEYWGGYERDPVALHEPWLERPQVVRLTGEDLESHLAQAQKGRATGLPIKGNGLEFCLTLARLSGATVRAGRLKQVEEIGTYEFERVDGVETKHVDDYPIMRDYDRFGNWEGPVWDFLPNGSVKYLGCNVPRHPYRFPQPQLGPALSLNQRGMDTNNASGQRAQRLDRSPLPA